MLSIFWNVPISRLSCFVSYGLVWKWKHKAVWYLPNQCRLQCYYPCGFLFLVHLRMYSGVWVHVLSFGNFRQFTNMNMELNISSFLFYPPGIGLVMFFCFLIACWILRTMFNSFWIFCPNSCRPIQLLAHLIILLQRFCWRRDTGWNVTGLFFLLYFLYLVLLWN